ncbi:hypothetical protein, partial [Salmonella enterica]|uniref:hypothetical protein n=1 Tax=Salmonella enterica TaxID=28901 RepID=UPI0019D7129C
DGSVSIPGESQTAVEIAPVAFCMLKFCSFKTSANNSKHNMCCMVKLFCVLRKSRIVIKGSHEKRK